MADDQTIVMKFTKPLWGVHAWLDICKLCCARPIKTILDVGAHHGETALDMLKWFPQSRVHCFEPAPETCKVLREAVFTVPRVFVHEMALGSYCCRMPMYTYPISLVNSLVPDTQYAAYNPMPATKIEVDVSTVDEVCRRRDIKEIDILKVDAEGYDLEVLNGGASMLRNRSVRYVYVEFNSLRSDQLTGSLAPIDSMLTWHGLRLVALYTDYVDTDQLFSVHNALYALSEK